MLDLCRRGHTVEDIYRSTELAVKYKLKAYVDFIFGLPEETETEVKETIKVINDLTKIGAIIHAHTFIPLPLTGFAKSSAGQIRPEIRNLLEYMMPKGLLFGSWQRQESLAQEMEEFINSQLY
jgi:radical SAM superfamily enzyme YgiQ (UPF0313 family)